MAVASERRSRRKTVDNKKKLFLVQLNPADCVTLSALFFSAYAILLIEQKSFFLAVAFLFCGMFADTYDGFLARKFGWESELGRYLDGFVDAFLYLMAPVFFLYQLSIQDAPSLIVFFIFLAAGILRLARFNITGNIKDENKLFYCGLPVFWSLFLLIPLFVLSFYLPKTIFVILCNGSLLLFSFFMLWNHPFFKPSNYIFIAILNISIIAVFITLHFML